MSDKITPTKAQLCAIGYEGSDLLISAGAGSGKTATLTRRIVERVTRERSPEDISRKLIVTFTKDAANELRVRINKALAEALRERPSSKHIASQIVKLGSADICTIDSFCLKLVKAHFEQLGLDGGFRIADESETEVLCSEAISEVLDELYEKKGEDVSFLRVCDCFSSFSGEDKLKSDLLSLYKKLITTKNGLKTLINLPSIEGDFLKSEYGKIICTHLLSFLDYYEGVCEYVVNEISGDEGDMGAFFKPFSADLLFIRELKALILDAPAYADACAKLNEYSAVKLGNTKKASHPDTELFKKLRSDFKDKLKDIKKSFFSSEGEILISSYEKNKSVCEALYEILSDFDCVYSKKKKLAGVCDFNDISRYALALLYDDNGELTPLSYDIASEYDEVYVDEYQDTNFVQDSIFRAVSSSNRFLVGDIKQSIYRFRSAEPEIFSSYRESFAPIDVEALEYDDEGNLVLPCGEEYKGGASLFMSENFRCDKSVIDFSNCVSNFMFGNSRGIPYQANDMLRFSKTDCDYSPDIPEIYLVDKTKGTSNEGDEDDEELLRREAEFVARRIRKMLDGEVLANGKKIKAGDIAILLRGFKKPVELYIDALKEQGINAEYRGDEHFFEKSEILLALCVLNAIDNPLRDVYLAGAMRSAIFGFSLEDMIRIRKASSKELSFYGALLAYDKGDALGEKIKEFLERLNKYRTLCLKKPAYEAISTIFADTGILSMASESEKRSLYKLYDIARSYESGKYKGLYSFLRYVEGVSDSSSKEELGSQGDDSVKLMSIHASKGLEFEVCFVAGCGSKINSMDSRDPILYHRDIGVCAYVSRDRGIAKFNTILRRVASLAIKRSSIEEEMRMLYVAMTRARSKLILTAGVSEPKAFWNECDKKSRFAKEYSVLNPKSYIDLVLGALSNDPSLAKIKVISADEMDAHDGDSTAPVEENTPERAELDRIKEALRTRFEFVYPYEHLRKIPSKLSMSRLHSTILDSEQNDEITLKYTLDDTPEFVCHAEGNATSAERGTATHLFMQFCDYARLASLGAKAELDRLLEKRFLSERQASLVNLHHIEMFIKSPLFKELLNARQMWRELRFNVLIDACELSSDPNLSSLQVLSQGVCDCVFENQEGALIIVDYKTDFVTLDNYVEVLTERHEAQLHYYRKALSEILGRSVSKTLIYSVPLAKTVELE